MKRTILAMMLLFLAQPGLAADDPPAKPPAVALKGLDPVALIAGKEIPGDAAITTVRGRFSYRFATAENQSKFVAKPEAYAAQSEMCAVMPNVPASPDLFLVHESKIFLFGSPMCREHFQNDPAAFLDPKPRKNVAIFIFDGLEILDFAGPGEVFSNAEMGRAFKVYTVAATSAPITSQGFVAITPQFTIADCPKPDILVIPGGSMRIPLADPASIDWIRKTSGEAEVSVSVCTGALLLAKAGRLDGLNATTHHQSLDILRAAAPKTKVLENVRFVDNGKVITSAGVSAGIDASLHLVSRLLGPDAAAQTAKVMEYRWEPETLAAPR